MGRKLKEDLLVMWLRDNAKRCLTEARKARAATKQPTMSYGACVTALAEAHEAAAEVYAAAADVAAGGSRPPAPPPCTVGDDGVELTLVNGCRIVSHGEDRVAGGDVHVLDATGREIGFWSADEWRDDPEVVMGALLCCAAQGCTADELAPDTERASSCAQDDEQ